MCQLRLSISAWTYHYLLDNRQRIIRYVKHTMSIRLQIRRSNSTLVYSLSDAGARHSDDRKSIRDFCSIFLALSLFPGVPQCEDQVQKPNISFWQMQLLKSFGWNHFLEKWELKQHHVSCLWCDSLEATYLIVNPIFHGSSIYIVIDFHFV